MLIATTMDQPRCLEQALASMFLAVVKMSQPQNQPRTVQSHAPTCGCHAIAKIRQFLPTLQKDVLLLSRGVAGCANIIKQAQIAKVAHHALDHVILNGDHQLAIAKMEVPQMAGVKYQMNVLDTGN